MGFIFFIQKDGLNIHLKVSKDIKESLKLLNGDILINRTNSKELVGKCAVFNKNETYIFASYLIRLRMDAEKADPHFVSFAINGPIGRMQINALSRQIIGQANINSQEIRSLKLPLPDLKVQQKMINNVNKARQKAASLRTEAKELLEKANTEIEQRILGFRLVEGYLRCSIPVKPSEFEGYFAEGVLGIFKIIRGFANLRNLAAVSVPYELSDGPEADRVVDYQRQLNEKHALDIKKYFEQSDNRIIPEVVLSLRGVFNNAILSDADVPICEEPVSGPR